MNPDPVAASAGVREPMNPPWLRRFMNRIVSRGRVEMQGRPHRLGRSRSINQEPLLEASFEDAVAEIPVEKVHEVAHDVAYLRVGFVNVLFLGSSSAGDRQWVLVDTGVPGMAGRIEKAARQRYLLLWRLWRVPRRQRQEHR